MMTTFPDSATAVKRFGPFEADLRSGELKKRGRKLRVGAQPFSVLAILLEHPGQVVLREELQRRLWTADTFVDFERGLNKAINRLREALDDSATAPCFIETLPKRGYRFIGQLDEPSPLPTPSDAPSMLAPQPPPAVPSAPEPSRPRETTASRSLAPRLTASWMIAMAALVIVAGVMLWTLRPRSGDGVPPPLVRASLLPPLGTSFVPYSIALAPDGSHLAFVAQAYDGSRGLWVRSMSATTAQAIPGTEGASFPFWSPDQRHLGFFADRKLKTVDLAGGAIRIIADARRATGGTWGVGGVIVFAPDVNGPLYRVAETGGPITPVTRVADGEGMRGDRWPVFLPDGQHFLYIALRGDADAEDGEVRAGLLPSPNGAALRSSAATTLESTLIWPDATRTVLFAHDHLFVVRAGALFAQPFDRAQLRVVGEPIPLTGRDVTGPDVFYPSAFSVSQTGVLAFQSSADLASHLQWLDVHGHPSDMVRGVSMISPSLSPDGRLLAGSCEGPRAGTLSICVHDFARGVTARVTPGPADRYPIWSRNGREIAYTSAGGIARVPADGSAAPTMIAPRGIPTGWAPDGRLLTFGSHHGVVSIALVSPRTNGQAEIQELAPGAEPQLSPDARWMAFIAPDGLVIVPFPTATPRIQVTGYGAAQPRWSRDGRHLFYIAPDKKLMAVDFDGIATAVVATATVSAPRALAQTRIIASALTGFQYDVAPDGRFLVHALTNDTAPMTVMTGWTSLLEH